MKNLSFRQFSGLAREVNDVGAEDAGFSVKASEVSTAHDLGDRAKDSYMVGGLTGAPEAEFDRPVRATDLRRYTRQNADHLDAPGAHLGGWAPSDRQKAYIDVSTAFPRTTVGQLSATYHGIVAGEDAIGEVDAAGKYAGDMDITRGMASTPRAVKGVEADLDSVPRTPQNRAKRGG